MRPHISTRSVRLLLVPAVLIALAGCGDAEPADPAASATDAAASSAAPSTAAAPSTPAAEPAQSTPLAPPMPSPADLPSVKAYGAGSLECAGMSAALMGATTIGGLANQGKVTQGDFESAYTSPLLNDIPIDAVPILADMKTASMSLVGLDAAAAQAQLGNFQGALSNLVVTADAVCS
jgi:hypothetical protein